MKEMSKLNITKGVDFSMKQRDWSGACWGRNGAILNRGEYPILDTERQRVTDVDGNEYIDFLPLTAPSILATGDGTT